ncbi:MAG: ABC transporter ATP-binding protein, partial [Pirellulales bacterium]
MSPPLLEIRDLKKYFPVRKGLFQRVVGHVHAVDDVSFTIQPGETLGLVGESGCGKTTVGRTLLRLYEPTAGTIHFRGQDVTHSRGAALRQLRRDMQI